MCGSKKNGFCGSKRSNRIRGAGADFYFLVQNNVCISNRQKVWAQSYCRIHYCLPQPDNRSKIDISQLSLWLLDYK